MYAGYINSIFIPRIQIFSGGVMMRTTTEKVMIDGRADRQNNVCAAFFRDKNADYYTLWVLEPGHIEIVDEKLSTGV